jgi:hypothetical protein
MAADIVQNVSNYRTLDAVLSRPRYARVSLNNLSSSSVPLGPTSTTLMEYKLPSRTCFNLSQSFMQYSWTAPAVAGQYICVFENGLDMCRSAYFGDGGGLGICDLQYADCYVNSMQPLKTEFREFVERDQQNMMYPCNQLNTSNILPFSRDGLLTGTQNASTTSYTEQQYLTISPNANQAVTVNRYLPLSAFKDTAFGMDKNWVFGRDTYIRFQTNYLQRMFFYTTTPANPNATQTTVTLNNIYLYLAIEENEVIRNSLLTSLTEGRIKMTIPYTYVYRFGTGQGASVTNISLTLTRQYGRKIKKICIVPYSASGEYNNGAYNHSNCNGAKINQYQTSIDSRPLTDYVLNCYNANSTIIPAGVTWNNPTTYSDDYRENRRFLNGSVLQNYSQYATNWFHMDAFGVTPTIDKVKQSVPEENILDGFDLTNGDHVYSLQANTGAGTAAANDAYGGLILYIYCTFVRTLVILPDGIAFE